jgi:hypothetical protein
MIWCVRMASSGCKLLVVRVGGALSISSATPMGSDGNGSLIVRMEGFPGLIAS